MSPELSWGPALQSDGMHLEGSKKNLDFRKRLFNCDILLLEEWQLGDYLAVSIKELFHRSRNTVEKPTKAKVVRQDSSKENELV